jgi:two-component system phosphate regulon sensor histidine kinase PhoR
MMFDPDGMIFVANPVARSLLGLSGDLSTTNAEKAFENFQGEVLAVPFTDLKELAGKSMEIVREEPKKLYLNIKVNPIHSRKQELFGYLAILRDVTQQKRADTAMHRFISVISHKLRTPLVAIRGYPPLLLSENAANPLDPFQRTAVGTILKECLRLENLVNELIAFSSLEPEELVRQPTGVQPLIEQAIKILPEEVQKAAAGVKMDASLARVVIDVDPTLMQHAFRNMLENAFKFGAKEIKVSAESESGAVTLRFHDNGPGIPPEESERVFERFYQIDKDFVGQIPGAGLGLTMVKETVQAHGGRVWVESAPGKGSTFFVKLPAPNKKK